jgi:pantoate--beta-alanine ligase
MKIIHEPQEYQRQGLDWRAERLRHAQIPTMGALHDGHFRLIEEGRRRADRVSVTLFVNPIQFNAAADLEKYPRTWEADVEGCERRGVDVLFAPDIAAMYPEGFQTHVEVEGTTAPMEGAHRPGHFRGVTTVVLKLFLLGQPTEAIFGWKDAQQLLTIRRMARDLDVPVEVVGMETVRESDGLAMSSRNVRLPAEDRARASGIYAGLAAAAAAFEQGERDARRLETIARDEILRSGPFEIEYIEARSMDTLERLEEAEPGRTLLAMAGWLGGVRLIDNVRM